jgi:hypothetical protein
MPTSIKTTRHVMATADQKPMRFTKLLIVPDCCLKYLIITGNAVVRERLLASCFAIVLE